MLKYIVMICLFAGMRNLANAQTDNQVKRSGEQISCAHIDANTLACYSHDVDVNNDGRISDKEWNEADPSQKGIVEMPLMPDEIDVFESDGVYEYEDLYEYDPDSYIDLDNYDGVINDEDTERIDFDLFDQEEDGAFE